MSHAAPANAIDIAAMTAVAPMVETSNGRASALSGANGVAEVCEKLTGGYYHLAQISIISHPDCDPSASQHHVSDERASALRGPRQS